MQESMVIGWLIIGKKKVALEGRALAIMEEIARMQEVVNKTSPGKAQVRLHCKGAEIAISLKEWREK